jgi:hypothetical protein
VPDSVCQCALCPHQMAYRFTVGAQWKLAAGAIAVGLGVSGLRRHSARCEASSSAVAPLALPPSPSAPAPAPALRPTRTLVVGGGLMGVTTAWYLARSGHAVVVVEADSRVASRGRPSWRNGGLICPSLLSPWTNAHVVQAYARRVLRTAVEAATHTLRDAAGWISGGTGLWPTANKPPSTATATLSDTNGDASAAAPPPPPPPPPMSVQPAVWLDPSFWQWAYHFARNCTGTYALSAER